MDEPAKPDATLASVPAAAAGPMRISEVLLALWRMSRPEFWLVSILPMYFGYVAASHRLLPAFGLWTDFWADAARQGADFGQFMEVFANSLPELVPFFLGLLVMGPLLTAASLMINDAYDLASDEINPRKARSPVVRGRVSIEFARRSAYAFGALALAASFAINLEFLFLAFGCLALAWIYSVPPFRLKARPGADLAVNVIGVGALSAMAGWSIVSSLGTFPFAFLPQGLLVAAAVYVPTTLLDYESDKASGSHTLATKLGPRVAYRVGWWSWVGANAGALLLSYNDWYIPRRMLPLLVLFVPVMLAEYHMFIGRARTPPDIFRGLIIVSMTFLAICLVFALMYTGLWTA